MIDVAASLHDACGWTQQRARSYVMSMPGAKSPSRVIVLMAALAWLSFASTAAAGTVSAARSGNWTDGSTWSGGRVPASGDMVAIILGYKVTIPAGRVVTNSGGIVVQEGALINSGTLNSSGELTLGYRSSGIQNNGTLVNTGTIKVDGTKLTNAGTLTNERTMSVVSGSSMGQLANTSSGVVTNKGKLDILGWSWNDGKIVNAGQLTLGSTTHLSKIEGSGAITNESSGTFTMAGNLAGNGPFVNAGTLQISDSGSNMQEGFWIRNTMENRGTIRLGFLLRVGSTGVLTNAKEGTITSVGSRLVNSGRVENHGTISTSECAQCAVANLNTLNNHCGATSGRVETKAPINVPCETGASTTAPPAPAAPGAFGVTSCSNVRGTTLPSGGKMKPGASFNSPNGKYELAYQTDGNLVVYELPSRRPLWSSRTNGTAPLELAMEADGNVVARKPDASVAWSTNTRGNAGAVLALQDDDNLVVYRKDTCQAVWARR